jgi:dUTP pyrophosphatase
MMAENIIGVRRVDALARLPTVTFTMKMACEVYSSEYQVIKPGRKALISTGIKLNLPPNYYATITGGQHADQLVDVHQSTIFYGDESTIRVLLENRSDRDFTICVGEVLAYIFIEPIEDPR